MVAITTAVKPPPRKTSSGRGPGRPAKAPDAPALTQAEIDASRRAQGLAGLGQLGQAILIATGQKADAATVGMYGDQLAVEVANVAGQEENAWLAKGIDFVIQLGPYGTLLAVLLPFGLQIAANHRWIDTERLGSKTVPPELLVAQMDAEIARVQAEQMRAQQEAIAAAKAEHARYQEFMATVNADATNGGSAS